MHRLSILSTGVIVSLVTAFGCNRAADEQQKADEARAEAAETIDDAAREASEKINAAQAEAEEKVAEAQKSFFKMREDFRHEVTEDMVQVDKDIAELEAKAKTATGKAKADIDAQLPSIRKLRENVMDEYRSLELASAVTWDEAKQRVNAAIDDLKKAVDKAD